MTLAAPFLYWLAGAAGFAAFIGFNRHKGLGLLMVILSGLLTFWAATGTSLNVHEPSIIHSHVTPSPSR